MKRSLSNCLKKVGLAKHEAAILRAMVKDNLDDGIAAHEAATLAVDAYIEELEAERADIVAQIEAAGIKPIDVDKKDEKGDTSEQRVQESAISDRQDQAANADYALKGETDAEIRQKDERQKAAAAQEKETAREAEQRERADLEREDFQLSGSEREADANAGQQALFSRPEDSGRARRDRLEAMPPVSAVFRQMEADFLVAKIAARTAYKPMQDATASAGFAATTTDGKQIKFSREGFKKAASHAADRRVLATLANIKSLIESAIPLYSSAPKNAEQQVKQYHYYGVKADFGARGEAYVLLEIIERNTGEFFYDTDATSVEEIGVTTSAPLADQTESGAGGEGITHKGRLAQWWHGVNDAEGDKANLSRQKTSGAGLAIPKIESLIAPFKAKWRALDIKVVQSTDDVPAGSVPSDVEGAYLGQGRVYLVADNLPTAERVYEVLAHEAIGHAAIEQMLGRDLMREVLKNVRSQELLNKTIRELGRIVDERQPGLSKDNRAKEIVALMAERGMYRDTALWKRVVEAVRRFLRELGLPSEWVNTFSEQDVFGLLRDAEKYLESGARAAGESRAQPALASAKAPALYSQETPTKPFSRFAKLRGPSSGSKEALADAKSLLGLHFDIQIVERSDLPERTPASFDLDTGQISFSKNLRLTRAQAAQFVAEELLHAVDSIGARRTLSAGSELFDAQDGQLSREAIEHYADKGPLTEWLVYPLADLSLTVSEVKAELFARLGVLYFGQPELLQRHLPKAYEVYHGIFGLVRDDPVSDSYVFGKIWSSPRGVAQTSGQPGRGNETPRRDVEGARNWNSDPELRRLRDTVSKAFGSSRLGTRVQFSRLDTRSTGSATLPAIPRQVSATPPSAQGNIPLTGGQGVSRASWNAPEPSRLDTLVYLLQDKLVDTKRVVAAVKEAAGALKDQWNPYLKETLYAGRTAKATQDFLEKELKPLLALLPSNGVKMAELEEFLHNRHAEERNVQIARVNPAMPDGGSGIDTADARAWLANLAPGKKAALTALAKRVDAINKATRQMLLDYGLESPDTIHAWESAYQNYVPLNREDLENGSGMGTGQGFSVKGSASKRATGSSRKVVDVLANIAMQRGRAIVRGEKNRVALALYGLAKLNPNADFWRTDQPPKIKTINDATGLVEERIDPSYKSRDNVVMARLYNSKSGKIEERSVLFNERNERAARMALALKNLDADQLGQVLGSAARVTRYFAAINTQYNPVFGVVNLIRDTQGALFNLTTTPIAGSQAAVLGNTIAALRGIYIDAREHRAGRQPLSAWAQLWEEFQRAGGQTGYRDMFRTSADRGQALQDEINAIADGTVKKAGKGIFNWLSDYNLAMENAVRLAAYKVAKEKGVPIEQAASMAKNLTVNFNRKGQIGVQAGALYAFFNASVQGTARLAETLKGPRGKQIVAGGVLLGAGQALLLAAMGFDDDEPPEFIRERNLVIPIGGKKYLMLPMPLGLHVIPNIGRIGTEYVLGGFKDSGEHVAKLLGVFAEAFNPIGNAGISLQTIAPTVIDPFAALAENKDWQGRAIARKDFSSLAPTPGHTRARDTASWFSEATSRALNAISGGTEYKPGAFSPSPDEIDYLAGQVTGGLGREVSKADQSVRSLFTGNDLPTYKIPLVGRLYGDSAGQSQQSGLFYDNLRDLSGHEMEIKGRQKDRGDVAGYLRDNPEAKLWGMANAVERQVAELRKQRRSLIEKEASPASIKLMDERMTNIMRGLNEKIKAAKAKEPA